MSPVSTIDEVLAELDRIIATTISESSPLGIFAYVYRRTTAQVAAGIQDRRFEDNSRMEAFDVAFARKYISAFWDFREDKPVSSAWGLAFGAAAVMGSAKPVLMQHLLLGMNAHINLDLGIAAAEITRGGPIGALEKDFLTINLLLETLIDEIEDRISRVSPLMFLLDWLGERGDEQIVNWSIIKARHFAWTFAGRLASVPEAEQQDLIRSADSHITEVGRCVADPPGFLLSGALAFIRYFEVKNTRTMIEALKR